MNNENVSNESNKKKKKPIKLIIVLIDIIAIILIVFSYTASMNKKPKEKIQDNTSDYTYKHFIYTIPNDISFNTDDYYIYLEEEDNWNAKIDILIDEKKYIRDNSDIMRNILVNAGYETEGNNTIKINNKDVIVYKARVSEINVILAYIYMDRGYVYEIELSDNSNNYNYEHLDVIANILINAKYNEENKYRFHVFDLANYIPNDHVNNSDEDAQ